jgi:hypothetical protein
MRSEDWGLSLYRIVHAERKHPEETPFGQVNGATKASAAGTHRGAQEDRLSCAA